MVILKMIVGHVNMMKNTTLQQNSPVYPEILLLLVTIVDDLTIHLTCVLSADLMQIAIEPMQLNIMIILSQKQVVLYAQFPQTEYFMYVMVHYSLLTMVQQEI